MTSCTAKAVPATPTACLMSGMTLLVRVTMPLTAIRRFMSVGLRSRMTFCSARLNVLTCEGTSRCLWAAASLAVPLSGSRQHSCNLLAIRLTAHVHMDPGQTLKGGGNGGQVEARPPLGCAAPQQLGLPYLACRCCVHRHGPPHPRGIQPMLVSHTRFPDQHAAAASTRVGAAIQL